MGKKMLFFFEYMRVGLKGRLKMRKTKKIKNLFISFAIEVLLMVVLVTGFLILPFVTQILKKRDFYASCWSSKNNSFEPTGEFGESQIFPPGYGENGG